MINHRPGIKLKITCVIRTGGKASDEDDSLLYEARRRLYQKIVREAD